MALYLSEQQVGELISVAECIELLERAFKSWFQGLAVNEPRRRLRFGAGMLHWLAAALPSLGYFGYKAYVSVRGTTRFHFYLFSSESGELLAVFEADRLGQIRTGAASGLATRLLAKPVTRVAAIIGSGWQAQSQLEAICAVRDFSEVRIWSRQPENVRTFIEQMTSRVSAPLTAAASARQAVEGAEVICTATSAREPIVRGEWIDEGCHINAIGANLLTRRELPTDLLSKADVLVVDSRRQARREAGDFLEGLETGALRLDRMRELAEVVANPDRGRNGLRQITVFKSLGLALEDLATAVAVYEKAKRQSSA